MTTFHLTVNGVSLLQPGFCRINRSLIGLLGGPSRRNDNLVLPYVEGRPAYKHWPDETVYDLELLVEGINDSAGDPHTDPVAGKIANLIYLRQNVALDSAITVEATLATPTGDLDADVQILNWMVARDEGTSALVTFDLLVPSGCFGAVEST